MDIDLSSQVGTDGSLPDADTSAPTLSGVPSYMVSADNHNLANSQASLVDPSTWGDAVTNGGEFVLAAATRAVTSTYNILPTVGNWLGGDFDKLDTGDVLRGFDDDLGKYYDSNKVGIDIVGDIAASFIPGMAGIKVLNWGQKAIALASEGRAGLGMAEAFGTLPAKQALYATKAAEEISSQTSAFNWINTNTLKSLAAGYGQNALEFAAFETAASTALHSSPLFQNEDVSDIFYNAALGGGLIGGGIMTGITAAQTYGAIRRATVAVSKVLRPSQAITGVAEGTSPSEKILQYITDLGNTPEVDTGLSDVLQGRQKQLLTQRESRINTGIRDEVQNLVNGNSDLGNTVADSLRGVDKDTAFANLMGLQEISKVGEIGKYEKSVIADSKAMQAADIKGNALDTSSTASLATPINPVDTKILRLHGEDAGTIYEKLPQGALTLADKVSDSDAVLKYVKSLGIKTTDDWSPITAKSSDEAEARYIAAQRMDSVPADTPIFHANLPVLEKAYELGTPVQVRFGPVGSEATTMEGNDLLSHIEDTKLQQASALLGQHELDISGKTEAMTTSEIARLTNTSVSYLEGTRDNSKRLDDLMAMQADSRNATADAVAKGLQDDPDKLVETYLQPKHVKLVYNPELLKMPGTMEADAMTYLQGRSIVYQMASDAVFANRVGDLLDTFPTKYSAEEVLNVNRLDTGNTMLSASNGNYGTALAKSELIGKMTSQLEKRNVEAIDTTFSGHQYAIKNSPVASLELATLRQQMLQTPEKYVWDAEAGALRNRKLVQYESDLAEYEANPYNAVSNPSGVKQPLDPVYVDTKAPTEIPVISSEMKEFIPDWIAHNDGQLTDRMALRNQQGMQVQDNRGNFYVPPPDPKQFPHFAFVVDPSVTATGHVKMIWAKNAVELQALADKVPSEFKVIYKTESEDYFKARREYDYNIGVNENYMDAALSRSGAAAPFFPKTDGSQIMDDLLEWRNREDRYLSKEIVYNKYSPAFDTFTKLGDQYASAATSVAKGSRAAAEGAGTNPFTDQIKTALNVSKANELPIWTPINNLVEKAFGSLANKVNGIWQTAKTPEELDQINSAFREAGINMVPQDAALNLLANHTADKPVLSNFIRKANGILSTLMLRADPLNAVNNGIGANVLLGAEASSVIRAIKAGNADAVSGLADLAQVQVPGLGNAAQVLSPAKLIAGSYANFWRKIMGNEDANASFDFWKKNGIISDTMSQAREMVDNLALPGGASNSEVKSRMDRATELMKGLGAKAEKYTGNTFAEEMNRFVAADVMKQITDLGIQHGVIDADTQMSMINSFVNRTQGNNLASQRPMLFQGPVGQAIGLFQTYQFNMLQQIFRHVAEGGTKDAGILLALQGSIYGMNGLPAFNAINTYLVGGAAGNVNHRDIVSTTYDAAGKGAADWLLYGLSSNMFLHPDLKVNLYSRGDINPRSVTVVPTNIADVPIVGAMSKFYGAVMSTAQKLSNGGDVGTTILQGIEHAGINRPLAGVAQVLEAAVTPSGKSFSTTTKGDIVMQNDLMSIANLSRLAGGKPLDEAIARDALFRIQSYQSSTSKQLQNLGGAVKSTLIAGGNPTQDQVDQFSGEYMKAGGKQENFSKFMHQSMLSANTSQANTIAEKLKSPYSQQMQKIMGGYELGDFKNDPVLNGSGS